jgi:multicomponent Na+:H+ antiporter subunit D
MSVELPVAAILIGAGLVAPLLPERFRPALLAAAPLVALWQLIGLAPGDALRAELFGLALEPVRVDRLSLAFGYVFVIAAFLNAIYAWHVRTALEPAAAMVYAGAAIGAVFAGDLVTLFVYWELTAVAALLVIWARGTERSFRAGMRYIAVQLASGMLLAGGATIQYSATGSLVFDSVGLNAPGGALLLLAFGIKCAFPLLHNWLQDAYPEATATGTVVLSAFTTKLGVYALARGFAGTEMLIWIGTAMAVFPIFYAVIENDLRRVLAYSMNNQLGFMVVGVGLGTEMGLNGAVAHAFADILFKGLLFMSMGAVLLRAGSVRGTDLGGLYKSMPWTAGFCVVGAASISGLPLLSAFVTKSMIMASAAAEGHLWTWLLLLFASAGVVEHAGIKIPYFAFFGHDSGIRCKEAPPNMLVAMALAAALCVGIGVFPGALYALLPHAVDYVPYTMDHVLTQLQLLAFASLGVFWLMRVGLYPPEQRAVNLDFDWTYRRAGPVLVAAAGVAIDALNAACARVVSASVGRFIAAGERAAAPGGLMARTRSTGVMAMWMAILLAAYLLVYYF